MSRDLRCMATGAPIIPRRRVRAEREQGAVAACWWFLGLLAVVALSAAFH